MQDHSIRKFRVAWMIPLFFVTGCVYVPYPFANKNEITKVERSFLKTGKTTRADVLLHFADPDLQFGRAFGDSGERFFEYHWSGKTGA